MPTITNAQLSITPPLGSTQTRRVSATCNVEFTPWEMLQMGNNLQLKVVCRLWGEDVAPDSDDLLHSFAPRLLPDATPTSQEKMVFDASFPPGALDEDVGVDKVYAVVTVINLSTMGRTAKKSNVVTGFF